MFRYINNESSPDPDREPGNRWRSDRYERSQWQTASKQVEKRVTLAYQPSFYLVQSEVMGPNTASCEDKLGVTCFQSGKAFSLAYSSIATCRAIVCAVTGQGRGRRIGV